MIIVVNDQDAIGNKCLLAESLETFLENKRSAESNDGNSKIIFVIYSLILLYGCYYDFMFGIKTRLVEVVRNNIGSCRGPEKIMINPISFKCNHRCPMCWLSGIKKRNAWVANEEKRSLQIEDYFELFSNLPKSVKEIEVIGGGEPLLYPKIKLIFQEIKRKKLVGSLVTNGSLLTAKMAKMLGKIGWNKVRISFNSATEIIYKKVNGVDDFNKIIGNINDIVNCRQSGQPEIVLHFVIQKYNFREIYDFGLMSKKLGINGVNFDYLLPQNKISEKLLLSDKEWLLAIGQLKQIKGLNGLKNNVDDVLERRKNHPKWNKNAKRKFYFEEKQCHTVNHFLYIFGDGRVLPCCVAGSIKEQFNIKDFTVAEIWQKYVGFRENVNRGKFYDFCIEKCNMG